MDRDEFYVPPHTPSGGGARVSIIILWFVVSFIWAYVCRMERDFKIRLDQLERGGRTSEIRNATPQ